MIVRLAAVALAALALAGPAAAACSHPRTSLGYLEGQIMCPTCHTTLDQSDAPAAHQIEGYIRQRIAECATADQIKTELVAQYGAGILAAPTHRGFDLLAWWLPIGAVLLGAGLLGFGVWRWSRSREDAPDQAAVAALNGHATASGLDPEEERRLDELLARLD